MYKITISVIKCNTNRKKKKRMIEKMSVSVLGIFSSAEVLIHTAETQIVMNQNRLPKRVVEISKQYPRLRNGTNYIVFYFRSV